MRIVINDEPSSMMPAIMGDRVQIERVLVNLVVNARDAMPKGGYLTIRTSDAWMDEGWSTVGSTELVPGPHVVLEVADTGIGMDAETRRRVFEPFFTTKDVGSGTGLGLSTAYGIVQQMGGAIEVESEPNRGARFRSYFPQASEPALTAARRIPPVDLGRGNETVLLVENEDAVRRYLTLLLESHGYHVIAAERATDALALTQEFRWPHRSRDQRHGDSGKHGARAVAPARPGAARVACALHVGLRGCRRRAPRADGQRRSAAVETVFVDRAPDENPPDPHGRLTSSAHSSRRRSADAV